MALILLVIASFFYLLLKISSAQTNRSYEEVCFDLLKERAPKIDLKIPFADYKEFSQNATIYQTHSSIIYQSPPPTYNNWTVYMFGNDTNIKILSDIKHPKEKMIIFYYDDYGFEGCGGLVLHPGTIDEHYNYTDVSKDTRTFTRIYGIRNMPNSYYANYYIYISKDSPKYEENRISTEKYKTINTIKTYIFVIVAIITISFAIINLSKSKLKNR